MLHRARAMDRYFRWRRLLSRRSAKDRLVSMRPVRRSASDVPRNNLGGMEPGGGWSRNCTLLHPDVRDYRILSPLFFASLVQDHAPCAIRFRRDGRDLRAARSTLVGVASSLASSTL